MSPGFPNQSAQVATVALFALGLTLLTHCLSRRLAVETLTSWTSMRQISWARLCIILLFIVSWLFFASCDILIFGFEVATYSYCAASVIACVVFYTASKILTYLFLLEKVHVVWAPNPNANRLSHPMFLVSLATVSLYSVVVVVFMAGKIHQMREDGVCIIGIKAFATIPVLTYDAYLNVFLTALFLWPTLRHRRPAVQSIARRSLIAAAISLSVSVINMAILTGDKGHQVAWVCLSFCGSDVGINALALFWASSPHSVDKREESTVEATASSDLPSLVIRPSLVTRPGAYSDTGFHFNFTSIKTASTHRISRGITAIPVAHVMQGSAVQRSAMEAQA